MVLQVEQINSVKIISLIGKLNLDGCPAVESAIQEIPAGDRVLFDLARLDYIASAGLRLFLQAAKFLAKTNGKLAVCSLTPNVAQIFRLSGFNTFLNIAPDRESGIRALGS